MTEATTAPTTETTPQPAATESTTAPQTPPEEKLYPKTGETVEEKKPPAPEPAEEPETESAEETSEEESKPKAPEKYEFATPEDMPEGFEFDTRVLDALSGVLRDLDVSQDDAQKLVDTVFPVLQERAAANAEAMREAWRETAEKDPEIGGSQTDKAQALVAKARDEFATKEFVELLDEGFGDHPEVRRFMARVGKWVSEDTHVAGQTGRARDLKDPDVQAQILYPTSKA